MGAIWSGGCGSGSAEKNAENNSAKGSANTVMFLFWTYIFVRTCMCMSPRVAPEPLALKPMSCIEPPNPVCVFRALCSRPATLLWTECKSLRAQGGGEV